MLNEFRIISGWIWYMNEKDLWHIQDKRTKKWFWMSDSVTNAPIFILFWSFHIHFLSDFDFDCCVLYKSYSYIT